ncbi:hypothetical protein LG293_16030 (plasmid) [Citricoccus nitrophenolicus]
MTLYPLAEDTMTETITENFMQALRAGRAEVEQFDDHVDRWHDTPVLERLPGQPPHPSLHGYLGLEWPQYQLTATDPDMLQRFADIMRSEHPELAVGQRVRFAGSRTSFTVQAVSETGRYVALNRKVTTPATGPTVQYTVIDFELGIRGTASSWGVGFQNQEQCQDALVAFEAGPEALMGSEVSWRNWVWLRFTDRQPDASVEPLLPALRRVAAVAPPRRRNDHEPRTLDELREWLA